MSRLTLLLCLFGVTCCQVLAEQGIEAIHGGDHPKNGFKYYALLFIKGSTHFCGAAIIDSFYVLTAAHCVAKPPFQIMEKPLHVKVGSHDLIRNEGIVHQVETIYVHKAVDLSKGEHDIAVLKLKHGLNLHHSNIAKLNLPEGHSNYVDVIAAISGFGVQSFEVRRNKEGMPEKFNIRFDRKLRYADATVITNAKCSYQNKKLIQPNFICAQVHQRNRGPEGICNGDSGGPLVHGNEVIGILITGVFMCDETNHASIYMRVSSYRNMIHNIISGRPGMDVMAFPAYH